MTSAAHELQQGPASAGRSHLRHVPFAMTLCSWMSVRPVGSMNWRGAPSGKVCLHAWGRRSGAGFSWLAIRFTTAGAGRLG